MILNKLKDKFKKSNPSLGKTIADIGLTDRTYHILRRAGVDTVGDLAQLRWVDIAKMRNSVRKTCEEIEKVLSGMGLGLRKEQ